MMGFSRFAASCLMLALAACATQPSNTPVPPERVNLATLPAAANAAAQGEDALTRALLGAINAYRTARDAPALADDPTLQHVAAVQSADMSIRNFFGHYNPDGQGPKERMLAVDPDFKSSLAENIAALTGLEAKTPAEAAAQFLKQWLLSPPHRQNIQNSAYTRTGIGIARKGDTIFVTELFAGP